jgi:uncharacterized protein YbaP (TraB family)
MIAVSLPAQSSVWQVSKDGYNLYLGGTCHILRASDYPLPIEFETAYQAADSLVFEIDPDTLKDPAFAMQIMAQSVYRDGRTLEGVLSTETYAALIETCQQQQIPIEVLQNMKPSMAVMMLTIQKLSHAGITQEGVDIHYAKQAKIDNKPSAELETAEFQLELITGLGEGIENQMVLYSLKDLEQIDVVFDQMITAWRKGDLAMLHQLFVADMAQYPKIYNELLKDRNERWIPQIEAMLQSKPTEFILVGVAHMAGEDGLIHRLRDRGYTVSQVGL